MSFDSVTVNVCDAPTGLFALGPIVIFAFTNVLTASPEFGETPSVATVIGVAVPRSDNVEVACPVTVPVEFDVNVIVH
jgi:hypothetical protein